MVQVVKRDLIIINKHAVVHKYNTETCLEAGNLYKRLLQDIRCTYLAYMYEDLASNEKFFYSSNQMWQDLLIGERFINHCPITLLAFNFLEENPFNTILLPWHMALARNEAEKKVCQLRLTFNIDNGISYAAKNQKKRESIDLGGEIGDQCFYKHAIDNPNLINNTLTQMRAIMMDKVAKLRRR
jgi:hypothetical protein